MKLLSVVYNACENKAVSGGGGSGGAAGGLKFTVADTCDRIKEEFSFIQSQYHTLKMECEKLANEKTEMQRHYVMYYEMSYGLNVEMHKQTEIAKRLNAIIAQVMPFLAQEHQQQVANAVERAKQVTMSELNAIIGQQQQQGLQQLLTEIAKRLNAIIAQVMPFLAQEHQQQVANAVERAKQVTMSELNAIIGQQQQQGLQQLLEDGLAEVEREVEVVKEDESEEEGV
ncbi:Transducin-like enhancer protein 3 [Harpegnathos saltator]|uniref:Transducin-like enhancer protein 3 n=1 Tax=Harpegnathos saltator TaxID=610380 RepID=E2B3A2_HARSA|nr:Transducin-like enhancer protein 3 [Harpegnathos saltator]